MTDFTFLQKHQQFKSKQNRFNKQNITCRHVENVQYQKVLVFEGSRLHRTIHTVQQWQQLGAFPF